MNKVQHCLLAITFFAVPLIATLKGKGTFILSLVLFLAFGIPYVIKKENLAHLWRQIKNPQKMAFWGVLFALWALVSCIWTADPVKAFSHCVRYAVFILTGYITFWTFTGFQRPDLEKYVKIYSIAYGVFFAYIVFEVFGPHWVSIYYTKSANIFNKRQFINAMVILLCLFWPFFVGCYQRWGTKIFKLFLWGVLPFTIFMFLNTEPNAVIVGAVVSTTAFILAYYLPKGIKALKYLLTIFCLSLPWVMAQTPWLKKYEYEIEHLPTSYQHRLFIWNGMVSKSDSLGKILFGNGYDFATSLSGNPRCFNFLPIQLTSTPWFIKSMPAEVYTTPTDIFTSHAHNGLIQIYVELGAVGVFLFLIMLWKVFSIVERENKPILRGVYLATLITYLTIFFISFGLWQTWMAGLMILVINSLVIFSKLYQIKLKD